MTEMNIVLMGGLSNTIFQYCYGRAQELRGHTVTFNNTEFNSNVRPVQDSDLHPAPYLNQHDAMRYVCAYGLDKFRTKVKFGPSVGKFHDTGVMFKPEYLYRDATSPMTLQGIWFSEKYFEEFSDILRQELQPNFPLPLDVVRLAHEMHEANSVFVHVRRGDFAIPVVTKTTGLLSAEYFIEGVDHIAKSTTTHSRVFVFSDDTTWCEKNLPWGNDSVVKIGDRWSQLWLMSQCKHGVLSNSSYSWFGAWLGDYQKNRIIIGPDTWLFDPDCKQKDWPIMPARWLVKEFK